MVTVCTMPFLPETPRYEHLHPGFENSVFANDFRWLYSHGQKQEAVTVLSRLMDCPEEDPQVQKIKDEMGESLILERQEIKSTWSSLYNDKTDVKNTRRLVLCFMIQMFQQFTGINVIAFYVTIVLNKNVGLSVDLSSLVAGFIQITFWIGTLPPIFLLDKLGRRPMLLGGSIMLSLSMILFTIAIAVNTGASTNLALAMLLLYEISFGMSLERDSVAVFP